MAEILYDDTRGHSKTPVSFSEAIVSGLAAGGGLFIPQRIPSLSLPDIYALAKLPYAQQAAAVFQAFETDLDTKTLEAVMVGAYGSNFDHEQICPLTSLGAATHLLELWHGPTSAFKDMALQVLPRLISASSHHVQSKRADQTPTTHQAGSILKRCDHRFLILVATSGDTGKAALEGFCNQEGTKIGVLYPSNNVSDIQFKQMATQQGSNVGVWGIQGTFDDCQKMVKHIFSDHQLNTMICNDYHTVLTSANSINWGRLLPQVVYYLSAYARLVASGKLTTTDRLDICVPTGNFGNILAAFYAKQMGVPIEMLLCASNENRVLTDFINTGTYDITNRSFIQTPSPSMDILVSSNLERLLFELSDHDAPAVARWMGDLRNKGRFRIDEHTFAHVRGLFSADSISNASCLSTIKEVFDEYGYLIDPHTAVAYKAAEHLRGENPLLIASTAHWAKFGPNVYRALHHIAADQPLPPSIENLSGCSLNELISRETKERHLPQNLKNLDRMALRHTQVLNNDVHEVTEAIITLLKD